RIQRRGEEEVGRGERPALEEALHRADLPTHAAGAEVSPGQWLQDLHRDRRRTGLCAPVCRGDLWHSPRTSRRLRGRDEVWLRQGGQTVPDQGTEDVA